MATTTNAVNATQLGPQMYDGLGHWTQGAYPMCHNLGISYSAGTFTVSGNDGTALSSTNPGYVVLQSKANSGLLKTILVTANQTFTDGSSGTTDNARFGLVTAVNWSNDIPFYLYAVMDDTESAIAFMISRMPHATSSPASTSISKSGSIINVSQADFFSLANVTLTSYDSNPCINLGSFRMQFIGATDSWTVQSLSYGDGIGQYNDQTIFTMPTGVNGSAASTYFQSNAGTVPQFNAGASGVFYYVRRNGQCNVIIELNTCTVAGVGAQALNPTIPYNDATGQDGIFGYSQAAAGTAYLLNATLNSANHYLEGLITQGGVAGAGYYVNASVMLNDNLTITFTYNIYNG